MNPEQRAPTESVTDKKDGPYLRMTTGHLKSLYRDLSIRREFGELGIVFPGPESKESSVHIPIDVLNSVGDKLYGRSKRTLRSNIGLEISNNLHHAFLSTYQTLIEASEGMGSLDRLKAGMFTNMMKNANDSLRQLSAVMLLSPGLLPPHYQMPDLDDLSKQLEDLNSRAEAMGFPVTEIVEKSD